MIKIADTKNKARVIPSTVLNANTCKYIQIMNIYTHLIIRAPSSTSSNFFVSDNQYHSNITLFD
jgi:hypothetical protein